jgi:hypothetical protein
MKAHQKPCLFHFHHPTTPIRHDEGWSDRVHIPCVLEAKTTATQLLFAGGLRKAVERIARSKSLWKQLRLVRRELLELVLRKVAISKTSLVLVLSQRSADGVGPFCRRIRDSSHGCLCLLRCHEVSAYL